MLARLARRLVQTLALTLALGAVAGAASAQEPTATGTLRTPDTGAAWGTFEVLPAQTTMGFFLRFRPSNGHVMTVMPDAMQADGRLRCTYIEYLLVGAWQPDGTQGWQWHEVANGVVMLDPATATDTSVDGTITETDTMIGYSRQPVANPQARPIRLSIP